MRVLSRIILLGTAAMLMAPAWAEPPARAARGGELVLAQQDGPSLSEAVEMVRRKYRGRIVSAETRVSGNREVHIIKVLTADGKVITERVPGRSLRG